MGAIAVEIEDGVAWLRRVAIRESDQRRGHGRRMVELAMGFAAHSGAERVLSNVNAGAVEFYRRLGFVETGVQVGDAVQMTKRP